MARAAAPSSTTMTSAISTMTAPRSLPAFSLATMFASPSPASSPESFLQASLVLCGRSVRGGRHQRLRLRLLVQIEAHVDLGQRRLFSGWERIDQLGSRANQKLGLALAQVL